MPDNDDTNKYGYEPFEGGRWAVYWYGCDTYPEGEEFLKDHYKTVMGIYRTASSAKTVSEILNVFAPDEAWQPTQNKGYLEFE